MFIDIVYAQNDPFKQVEKLKNIKNKNSRILKNIERWSKIASVMPKKFILVNIPTYTLYAVSHGKIEFTQRVIVGMQSRKTPLFTTVLNRVVFNPSWSIPPSIFMKDKLRKVLHDPSYLRRCGYIVRDQNGNEKNPTTIAWSSLSSSYFPYTIQQKPGKKNALGVIKFELDNQQGIKIHGTPMSHLFNQKSRALSSGCVRIENPLKLAQWVLGHNVSLPKNTVGMVPNEPVLVFFTYITAWVDNAKVIFTEDPYSFD
jgi:murein L,D-transpeptidase YcbB/YkuD